MNILEALLLGVIQGLTEFFPVSSSGHLKIAEALFGWTHLDRYILFDLVCHLGTLLAILFVFAIEVRKTLTTDATRLKQIVVATLPLFLLIPIMGPIKALFNQPQYLGFFFLITALLLTLGMQFTKIKTPELKLQQRWTDALFIGFFQLIAILPGISRSGATITAGWMRGWDRREAVVFSFLLAIPAILGGSLIEMIQLYRGHMEPSPVTLPQYLAGFTTSFAVGYGALLCLLRLAIKERFQYFVYYCLALGCWALWYFQS